MNTKEKILEEFKINYPWRQHTKAGGKDIEMIVADYKEITKFLSNSLELLEKDLREEMVEKSFDWIWSRWNLDLANKDRAKESFLNSIKQP